MLGSGNPVKTLIMKGPDGEKKYSVESAKWCIEDGDVREDVPFLICLRMECGLAVWEISFSEVEVFDSYLQRGFMSSLPESKKESEADLFLKDHHPTYDNRLEVLDRKDGSLLLKITGKLKTEGPDAPGTLTELEATAWFTKVNCGGRDVHCKCKECGKTYFSRSTTNTIFMCPECYAYNRCICDYGFGPIAPCDILLGDREVGSILRGDNSYSLAVYGTKKTIRLQKGYKELEIYKEAAERTKEQLKLIGKPVKKSFRRKFFEH